MAALRDNQGKPQLSFVWRMPKALEALARVFEQGAIKYARDNWLKGGKPDEEYIDSASRHMLKLANGEVYDDETGCMHAAHVMWNMGALIQLNDRATFDQFFDQAAFVGKYSKPVIPAATDDGPYHLKYIPPNSKAPERYVYTDIHGKQWTDADVAKAADNAVQAGARAKNVVDL